MMPPSNPWRWASLFGCVFFAVLFSLGYHGRLDFWFSLTASSAGCAALGIFSDPEYRNRLRRSLSPAFAFDIAIGLASAAVLFIIFSIGNQLSRSWLPFAGSEIEAVYALKQGVGTFRIAGLIILIIAPSEELFWRGFLQHRLAKQYGVPAGWAASSVLYAAVHLPSGNIMLTLAALAGGLFWGALYAWRRSLTAPILSHIAWDLAVFILWPFS